MSWALRDLCDVCCTGNCSQAYLFAAFEGGQSYQQQQAQLRFVRVATYSSRRVSGANYNARSRYIVDDVGNFIHDEYCLFRRLSIRFIFFAACMAISYTSQMVSKGSNLPQKSDSQISCAASGWIRHMPNAMDERPVYQSVRRYPHSREGRISR